MGAITKIEWCHSTVNPVSGCRHPCRYCYARNIANRFTPSALYNADHNVVSPAKYKSNGVYDLPEPLYFYTKKGDFKKSSYPFGFAPTFHRYLLGEISKGRQPKIKFVGSMCDLFGDWVPDSWIQDVFDTCAAAPQHRYLFLTKNPKRLYKLARAEMLPPNYWYGCSVENDQQIFRITNDKGGANERGLFSSGGLYNTIASIEPLQEWWEEGCEAQGIRSALSGDWLKKVNWVIIGAESGKHKGKTVPKREWIENIAKACDESGIPVFMKESIAPIVGEGYMRREFPEELQLTYGRHHG